MDLLPEMDRDKPNARTEEGYAMSDLSYRRCLESVRLDNNSSGDVAEGRSPINNIEGSKASQQIFNAVG